MISIRRSSVERSPPLASGWCCFTSALYFALTISSVASGPSPITWSALRSAFITLRVSALACWAPGRPAAAAVELGKHMEGIGGALEISLDAAFALFGAGVGTHLPGRPVAGQRVLLVARD